MDRNLPVAVGRGLMGRCPRCGKGAMFRGYLSVNPRCPVCGEDLSFQRADDAPAFVTLLVICFVGGAGVLGSDVASPQTPLLAVALFWLVVTAVASLLVLRLTKGAVIGYQWALRMHGFAGQRGGRAIPNKNFLLPFCSPGGGAVWWYQSLHLVSASFATSTPVPATARYLHIAHVPSVLPRS
jgi:uncharacterized protein (DUF983 family)